MPVRSRHPLGLWGGALLVLLFVPACVSLNVESLTQQQFPARPTHQVGDIVQTDPTAPL